MLCMFFHYQFFCQNLIQNGSFELYDSINCSGGGFDNYTITPPPHVVDNWYSFNSPDYFNAICGAGGYSVPDSWWGDSYAKNGLAFAGFAGYAGIGNENKEYIYQQLSSPLVSGKTYLLNFYVTLADASNGAIKSIGAYLCSNLPSLTSFSYINVIPQIENQNGFITDTLNWVQIQGMYNALGGEQYIIFGNFNSNTNTDTTKVNTSYTNTNNYPRLSYYYIDDITLIDQSTVGVNELSVSTKINLHPNPNNGLMQLDYDLGIETAGICKIMDVTGKIIDTYKLSETKGTINMNEQNLNNGIYFYCILVNNKIVNTNKIVIIK